MILADTNLLVDYLRGIEPGCSAVRRALHRQTLGTTAVTVFELHHGVRSDKQKQSVEDLLGALTVVPLDGPAAGEAGRLYRELEKRGRRIGVPDTLIAGVCLATGIPLATNNRRHFGRIQGLMLADLGPQDPSEP